MAPEQFQRPRDVGPAADVFAMGAVLVHAATGRGPFDSDSHYIVAYQVVHNEPDLTGVPDDLEPVLRDCLAKDPGDRPTPDELMSALRSAAYGSEAHIRTQRFRNPVRGKSAAAESAGASRPSRRVRGRARWVLGALALVGIAGGAVAGLQALPDGTGTETVAAAPEQGAASRFRPWSVQLPGKGTGENRMPFCSMRPGRPLPLLCRARRRGRPARSPRREDPVVRAGGGRGDALRRPRSGRHAAARCSYGCPGAGRCAPTTPAPGSRCGRWTCRRTPGCVPRATPCCFRRPTAGSPRSTPLPGS